MKGEKLYKVFSDSLIESLSITTKRSYFYYTNDKTMFLKESPIDKTDVKPFFMVEDETRKWNELRHNQSMYMTIQFKMKNIYKIFYGDDRTCFQNTVLGIGLEWRAANSKIRRCVKITEFTNATEEIDAIKEKIEIKYPSENIDFYWFVYIVKPGKETHVENERFANSYGLILGRGLLWRLVSKGNTSIFPIENYFNEKGPLWSIRCDFSNWEEYQFNIDNVSILLNQAHPLFECVKYDSDSYNEDFFKEVIASALSTLILSIISKAKEQQSYNDLLNSHDEEAGSILYVIRYFKNALGFKIDSEPHILSESIKMFFDKEKGLCK